METFSGLVCCVVPGSCGWKVFSLRNLYINEDGLKCNLRLSWLVKFFSKFRKKIGVFPGRCKVTDLAFVFNR